MIWAGDNEIPPGRFQSIENARENNKNFDFVLVTGDTIKDWEKQQDRIPEVFYKLSYVHQSDFLRAYLLHYYGGVYIDIKNFQGSWQKTVEDLNKSPDILASGVREVSIFHCNPALGPLGKTQKENFSRLINIGAVACKPGTVFTLEWLNEVKRRVNYFEDILLENPAEQPWGNNSNYPVPWTALGGEIFSPLCLKYSNNILAGADSALSESYIEAILEGKHRE